MKIRRLLIVVELIIACLLSCHIALAGSYNVQVLPEGAFALNDVGQVALRSLQGRDGGGKPYYSIQLWQSGNITTLGTALFAQGYSLNNLGQVAGSYEPGTPQVKVACVWSTAGLRNIISGENANASSINDAGYVTGTYGTSYNSRHGYIWDGETITELTAAGAVNSEAYCINNSNQITGLVAYQMTPEGDSPYLEDFPIIWHDGIASFLNEQGFSAIPGLINNAGQVLGYKFNPNPYSVLWSNGNITSINGFGNGLNDSGQIVGDSKSFAFLWQNDSMVDLNSLISTNSSDYIQYGLDINNTAQILAGGYYTDANGEGIACSFLLTPVPEPSTPFTLVCGISGLCGMLLRRKGRM